MRRYVACAVLVAIGRSSIVCFEACSVFGQRACYTRAIVMAKVIALLFAQLCPGIAALRAQEAPDPDITKIDVRMESDPEKAVLGTLEASSAGRAAVQPSAFMSNRGADGGAFERKAQALMVWLNLHKSTLHASRSPLSSDAAVSTDGVAHPAAFLDVATSPLDSIVALVQAAPVQLTEPSEGVNAASAVMREAAQAAAPPSPFAGRVLDPLLGRGALACDYDFEEACPESFVLVGESAVCAARRLRIAVDARVWVLGSNSGGPFEPVHVSLKESMQAFIGSMQAKHARCRASMKVSM